ncbi:MAG: tetratricopeptide repeat protein [Bacteroidetes bacterium]|nr:tetratricopeptide repeat protein [Bacteroidota bacterium]
MKPLLPFLFIAVSLSINAQGLKEANELIENFQFEKALQVLVQLNDSTDIHIPLQSGYCYSRLGNYKSAIENYKQALQIDSLNRISLNQLGQIYSRTNQYALAEDCYKKLIYIDSLNSFYFKQYAALAASTNYDSLAAMLYFKTLKLNPRDIESYSSLGNILLEGENYYQLDSLIGRALFVDSLQSSILLLKAKSELAQHKYKKVIVTVKKILEWNDTQPIHARLLGISYFQLNEYAKVVECMNYLLLSGVKSEWVYYYLGASYRELNDLPKSIDAMSKAIEGGISENIGVYYSQLAKAYEESKDYKNAIHYYQAAYEKSKTKILLYHLARNYDVYFKDKSSAIAYYKRYLASDDTIKLAREYSRRRLDVLE